MITATTAHMQISNKCLSVKIPGTKDTDKASGQQVCTTVTLI